MRFYMLVKDGYIVEIGNGYGGLEITQEEYDRIFEIITNAPVNNDETIYKLSIDLCWVALKNTETDSNSQSYSLNTRAEVK